MTSQRRPEAIRRNARKSTGPRTAAGNAAVAQNAVRRGLPSTKLLIQDEVEAELFGLAERLHAELRPEGELEELLVDRAVTACWRLRRIPHFEAALLDDKEITFRSAADKFAIYARETMNNVSRYEAQHESSLYKALRELQRLQAARAAAAAQGGAVEPGEAMRRGRVARRLVV
jgi:hypothetical protein